MAISFKENALCLNNFSIILIILIFFDSFKKFNDFNSFVVFIFKKFPRCARQVVKNFLRDIMKNQ